MADVESSTAESQGLLAGNVADTASESQPTTTGTTCETNNNDTNDEEEELLERARQEWQDRLIACQSVCCLIAHGLAVLCVVLVGWWVHHLGGLSWEVDHVFNWHPVLMVLAFCFMTVATLSFRTPNLFLRRHNNNNNNNSNNDGGCRYWKKLIHGSSWGISIVFGMVALIAVFRSHNDGPKKIANLYSFHSWFGIGIIGVYLVQFLVGFFSFWYNYFQFTPLTKAKILSIHSFLGPVLYVGVTAAILLGIQEKEGFVSCSYKVTKPDYFPLSHLSLIPTVCIVSHLLGIVVLATALCTTFVLHDFSKRN